VSIDAIRQFLRHPDCIVFVGSGVSMWSGLPSWGGLLEQLAVHLENDGQSAELVRREIANRELLQAASYGVSKLTQASFGSFVRKATKVGEARPHKIHQALVNLGPTSFITTNYDNLIEQALAAWRPAITFAGSVTNKHLVELADILSARSSNFVFKPHGDVGDISSIILTREQYRLLLPGGERHNALEALKTLLITRPVLYVGFGLRDPDFIYLRDLLLNIYQGATRDHWAIMPDVSDDEIDYWRKEYGIRLHGYATRAQDGEKRDHAELIILLESLGLPEVVTPSADVQIKGSLAKLDAERVLGLTRYASGILRRHALTSDPIEVRVSHRRNDNTRFVGFGEFEGWTTTRYLTEGPRPAYLIGLPGAGKSFALRLAAHQLASQLQQACMEDDLKAEDLSLPVLIDLKLFSGDLRALIADQLPAGFSLDELRGDLQVILFLDAFNEMSSDHIESGIIFDEIDALEKEIGSFTYAIASRSPDGILDRSDGSSIYEIDRFGELHVNAVLAERQIVLGGAFADDVRSLLSRPFFLQLVMKGLVEVPANARPRDVYTAYISKLQDQFSQRFETDFQLLPVFARVAFRAIESESEVFPLAWLSDDIAASSPTSGPLNPTDVINWLVGRDVLIPYTDRRASFVHQSITEFCAASELARRAEIEMISLRDAITSKKWDQCLFLALELMSEGRALQVLEDAVETDVRLAINAVRFAEQGQSQAISHLLKVILDRARGANSRRRDHWFSLHSLPVGPEHADLLRQIVELRNSIGGEAVLLLGKIEGESYKSFLLDLLEKYADEFNFSVNGVSPALMPLLNKSDLPRLLKIADYWLSKGDDDGYSSISDALSVFDSNILQEFVPAPLAKIDPKMVNLISGALRNRDDVASFELLANFLLTHPNVVTSNIALSLSGREGSVEKYACLDKRHIEAIWNARFSQSLWASALRRVCQMRSDLADYATELSGKHDGIEAIALRFCAGAKDELLFQATEQLLQRDDASLKDEPFSIFNLRKLVWRGREELLVKTLSRDIPQLRKALLDEPFRSARLRQGQIGLDLLKPVIDLLETYEEDDWITKSRLGETVAVLGNNEVRDYCLRALVQGPTYLQNWVKRHYIGRAEGLTTDALDDEMVAVLLADLPVPGRIFEHWYNPLANIATDRFVRDRLLPLASGASEPFRENLRIVLSAAGDKLGKRYRMPE